MLSILWHAGINLVGPCEDAALEIEDFAEAGFAQEIHGFRRALSAAAVRDDFTRRVQFVNAARQFAERDQVTLQIADLKFMRLAHIQDEEIVSAVEARFQLARGNLRDLHIRAGSFFTAHAAKFVVIDELVNGAMLAAHWTSRIFAQLEFAEFHAERIEEQQPANEALAAAKNQLDGFHRLDGTDDARQHAQHAALSAGGHESWRRRFRIQAAVARSFRHAEHRSLPFKAKDRAVNVWLAEQNARVVDEIARREIIGAIHNDVEILE